MNELPEPLRVALEAFIKRPRILIGADFDGTLAPFATDPMEARAAPGALTSLYAAASLRGVTVALVSGRDLETLRTLTAISRTSPIVLIGSHGAQSSLEDVQGPGTLDRSSLQDVEGSGTLDRSSLESPDGSAILDAELGARLAAARADLEEVAAAHPGTRIELKPGAIALHTRGVHPSVGAAALAAAMELSTRHTGVQVIPGKEVVELTVVQTNKGLALRALATARRVEATAYFGDDVTDERAFAALDPRSGDVTVKVGTGDTVAGYRLDAVNDVVAALVFMVSARRSILGD